MRKSSSRLAAIVVNDDPTQLAILARLLDKAGFDARAFEGVEDALAAMEASPPHLIVTDLYMPGIDGWRFCRLLRSPEYAALNDVPIFVVSATFSGDHAERIVADIGADAFLAAPVDGSEFVEQARSLIRGDKGRRLPRVLIIEGDETLSKLLTKVFRANGYLADAALSASEAEAAFAKVLYDAVVLDHHLSDGAGDVLLRLFRTRRPDCTYFMMTTDPTPQHALEWMKQGASAYICKPFDPEYLIELCARGRRERALLRIEDLLEARTRELRESEEKYRVLFNHSMEGIYLHDSEGRIVEVNEMACAQSVYSREELLGLTVFNLHPSQSATNASRADILRDWRQWQPGERVVVEAEHQRKDGAVYPVEISAGVVHYGGSDCVMAIVRDITERKEAETALRRSEEVQRTLLNGLPDIVMRFDREGRHLFVSDNVRETVDMEASQFIGKTHAELGFPQDLCRLWEKSIQRVFDSGAPFETEFTFDGKDGPAICDWRLFPERDEQGAVRSVLSVSRDITEHRQTEQEYQTLFREMLDGFALHEIICDELGVPVDYRFVAVNPAFERMTGLKAEAVVGRTVNELLPGTERHWIETYGKVALSGEPAFFENYAAQFGKHFEVTAFCPAPLQFACIFQDITERKQAEEEREKLQAQLAQAQKMESVGRLAGGVAHDFNNMLGVILGHVDLARDQLGTDAALSADLDEIHKAAQRSADLTRQLLAFARKQTVAPRVLDLNSTIEGILKMLRRLIGENIDLVWLPGEDTWPAKMDPSQLDQILANLFVNARDAITGVGRITIATRNTVLDRVYCAQHADASPGEHVRLTVSDTGCGMDAETFSHLFEPFFTTKEQGKGTGLGLASVYGAVRQNLGSIDVRSEPGMGTTFGIYLPRHFAKGAQEADAHPARPLARGSETLLLVEDEAPLLRVTSTMLEDLGYRVLKAITPQEAIRLAREHPGRIDLLMTDVVMPGMDGRELAQCVLSICPEIACLFTSGYTADIIADQGVLQGGVQFIPKPFSIKDLAAKIREVLGGGQENTI